MMFAVLEVAQAPLDKESCSTKVMKTWRELRFARISKAGARVNSSKCWRRETQREGSCGSAEVSRGRRQEGCRGKLEKLNCWKMVLPERRRQTPQSSERFSCQILSYKTLQPVDGSDHLITICFEFISVAGPQSWKH